MRKAGIPVCTAVWLEIDGTSFHPAAMWRNFILALAIGMAAN